MYFEIVRRAYRTHGVSKELTEALGNFFERFIDPPEGMDEDAFYSLQGLYGALLLWVESPQEGLDEEELNDYCIALIDGGKERFI